MQVKLILNYPRALAITLKDNIFEGIAFAHIVCEMKLFQCCQECQINLIGVEIQ